LRLNASPPVSVVHLVLKLVGLLIPLGLLPTCLFAAPNAIPNTFRMASNSGPAQSTVGDLLERRISLGDGRTLWHPTREQLGFRPAPGISDSSPMSQAKFTIDHDSLVGYLNGISPYVRRAPINAHPVVLAQYAGRDMYVSSTAVAIPCKIIPECDGGSLLVDQSATAIEQAVAASPMADHVALVLKPWPATVTTDSLKGIDSLLGHFVTHFNTGEVGRTETVRRAIVLIDGHIVPPGQIFSVNDTVGERTAVRGFGEGHVFINGHMEMQLGGGMCQVATTLFNSVLLAGLKIVERHQHVRTVPYVKAGSDATVYWGAKDFKFQNDTTMPVYISYHTTTSHAICDVYGVGKPGRTIQIIATQRRLGARDYTGFIQRIVELNGVKTSDYTAYSSYKWPPSLDYSR